MKLNAEIQEAGERSWATGVRNCSLSQMWQYPTHSNAGKQLEQTKKPDLRTTQGQSYSHWLERLSLGGTLKVFQTTSVDIKCEWTQSSAGECNSVLQQRQNTAFKTKFNTSHAEFWASSFQEGTCLFSSVASHKILNILKILTKRFDKNNKLYTQIPKPLPKEIKDDQDWQKNIMSIDLSTQCCQEGNTTHADLHQCVPIRVTAGFRLKWSHCNKVYI